jgi:hypothetical protein
MFRQLKVCGAGGARTHDRRIMRTTVPCTVRASCTDGTGLSHRRHSRRWDHPVTRSTNRSTPDALHLVILLLCVTSL